MTKIEDTGCAFGSRCEVHLADGRLFDIENPDPAMISLRQAAKALSRICRWGGRIIDEADFFSVAQHSIYVQDVAATWGGSDATKLATLWHDAAEWITYDWPRPIKRRFPEIKAIEERIQGLIYAELGLGPHDYDADLVKRADNAAQRAEARIICRGSSRWDWGDTPEIDLPTFQDPDDCRSPRAAFEMFWARHCHLTTVTR